MAESPLDRLKRLAAEKRAATLAAQPAVVETKQPEVVSDERVGEVSGDPRESGGILFTGANPGESSTGDNQTTGQSPVLEQETPDRGAVEQDTSISDSGCALATIQVEDAGTVVSDNKSIDIGLPVSDHPLAMQFAEMEAALLAKDPQFKTILRQIHNHLGKEPELVTQMTEQEIQLIVTGLVVFANAEIVEPAKAKATKSKIAAAKKVVISADDL